MGVLTRRAHLVEMLLVARPILGGLGVRLGFGIVVEAASPLAGVTAAAGAGRGDVVPVLVVVVEALLGHLLPRAGAAPASGRGGEVALVVVVVVVAAVGVVLVDLGGVEVRGEVPAAAKGEGGEPGCGLGVVGGVGVRVWWIHGSCLLCLCCAVLCVPLRLRAKGREEMGARLRSES